MPPFNRSALTYTLAKTEVAGSAGSTTTEMLDRAGNSLDAVAQRWNRMRWKFLQSEQTIGLVAPFTVTGCTTTAGSTAVSTTDTFTAVVADDVVSGGGVRAQTLVDSVTNATSLVLAASASASVTGATLTFQRPIYSLASDYKTIFDIRLLGNPKPLYYQPRRNYDRDVIDQHSGGESYGYDLYFVGGKGKIRFVPPPAGTDTVLLKYYRRITMPSALATAVGLDIPEDYEDVFLAAAKAHFLVDKSQTNREQYTFWKDYARDGLSEMRRDERVIEDEDLALQPPIPRRVYGPNSPFYEGDRGY